MSRVKYKKPRQKRVKPPAPVHPSKPFRPKRSELRKIYKELLSADIDQRINALAQAMSWYDKCLVYINFKQEWKWTTSQLREKNKGEKSRSVGIGSEDSKKKETEFIATIQAFEKVVKDFKPPLISKVLAKYNKEKPKLEGRRKKFKSKFGEFLTQIQTIFKPKNADDKSISLYVDKLKSEYRISTEGNITFDRKFLGSVRSITRKQGLLPGALKLFPVFTEAAGRIPEVDSLKHKTGRTVVSSARRYKASLDMLENLVHYYMKAENPKKLIRRIKEKPSEENSRS